MILLTLLLENPYDECMIHNPHPHHENNLKAIIYMFIVLLAFGVLLIFYTNSEEILSSNKFYLFVTLATVGMGLMLTLMYLVSNSKHPSHHKPAATHKKSPTVSSKKGVAKKKKK